MTELTLQQLQHENLNILKDVHDFCTRYNIRYSLAYGTLIGAVRHKGFIPWDDDIDLWMPRPDYERFCRIYTSENNELIYSGNSSDCLISYARVCDRNKTIVTGASWINRPVGIWIDIFPIDNVEDDNDAFLSHRKDILSKWYSLWHYRAIISGQSGNSKSLMFASKLYQIKPIKLIVDWMAGKCVKKMVSVCSKIPFGSSSYCSSLSCPDNGEQERYDVACFNSFMEVPFEGYRFMASEKYDTILRTVYGDYMKLPPEKEQVPKQNYIKFYWK